MVYHVSHWPARAGDEDDGTPDGQEVARVVGILIENAKDSAVVVDKVQISRGRLQTEADGPLKDTAREVMLKHLRGGK